MKTPVGYQILLSLTMQMFGLGLAGMAYKYIIEPPQMVRASPSHLSESTVLIQIRSGHRLLPTRHCSRHCTARQIPLPTTGASLATSSSYTSSLEVSAGTGFRVSSLLD